MEKTGFSDLMRSIFSQNGLQGFCTDEILHKFERFTVLFMDANARFNLSAIRDVPGIIAKHYADCLLAAPFLPEGATVLDVGCGGGFPCIPLAIARPDLRITALDSTQKKIDFLKDAACQLELANLDPICGRAEELCGACGTFDAVTSRAVARLNVLSELCVPHLKLGGCMVALKGAQGADELAEAENALEVLGIGKREDVYKELRTADAVEARHIILAFKQRKTPAGYPRRFAEIRKRPL